MGVTGLPLPPEKLLANFERIVYQTATSIPSRHWTDATAWRYHRANGMRATRTWPVAVLTRLLLVAFGVCMGLLLIEGMLRAGSLFVHARQELRPSTSTDVSRVLCLGDSNTYGLWVDKGQTYPDVFQSSWNAHHDSRIQTVNLGYPGTHSAQVAAEFAQVIAVLRPQAVLVMVGVNDLWSAAQPRYERSPLERWLDTASRHSRLIRFLAATQFAAQSLRLVPAESPPPPASDGDAGEPPAEPPPPVSSAGPTDHGGEPPPSRRTSDLATSLRKLQVRAGRPQRFPASGASTEARIRELEENLEAVAAEARDSAVPLIFLTYPSDSGTYRLANGSIRAVAERTATPLIDLGAEFGKLCPTEHCPTFFYGDGHPRALGYARVASILVDRLTDPGDSPP